MSLADAGSGSVAELRVVSLNIRNGLGLDGRHAWPFRRRALVRALHELEANVLCLQEVRGWQRRYLVGRLGAAWRGCGRPRGRFGFGEQCLVLARADVFDIGASRTRWFGDLPDRPGSRILGASHPRVATTAVLIHRASGLELGVANVHLDASVAAHRVRSAHQLVDWLDASRPAIVAGDFNARPSSESVAVVLAAGYRDTLPPDGPATVHRFTGRTDGPRFDYVFTSADCDVERAWVATPRPSGKLISDHWPVVADVRLTGSDRCVCAKGASGTQDRLQTSVR